VIPLGHTWDTMSEALPTNDKSHPERQVAFWLVAKSVMSERG
jgi:hypothetical protein